MSQHVWRKKSYLSVWQTAEDAILFGPVSKETKPKKNKPQPSSNAFQHCTFNFKGSIQRFFQIKKQELFVVSSAVPLRGEAEAAPRRVEGMKAFCGLDASLELGLIWPGPPLWIPAKSHESHMETHMDIYENHGSDMEICMFFPKINTGHDSNNVYNNCSDLQSLNMSHKARLYYILS